MLTAVESDKETCRTRKAVGRKQQTDMSTAGEESDKETCRTRQAVGRK
jgi:hypothetical protein